MDPLQQGNLGANETPAQINNVMVDLLHPQEIPPTEATPPPAPVVAPAPPPVAAPVLPPPPAAPATPVVAQIGTTQLPRTKKPFPTKVVAILAGVVLFLGSGGLGAYVLFKPKPAPVAAAPVRVQAGPISNPSQSIGSSVLASGGATNQSPILLGFDFATTANRGAVVPEVEVEPVGTAFTGTPTISGSEVSASGRTLHLSVPMTGLKDGSYHWQARAKVSDQAGNWLPFSADALSFAVDTVAPSAPVISSVGASKVSGASVKITAVRPVFSGTAEAGSAITLSVKPEGVNYTATTGTDGKWAATPTADLPNGDHVVSIVARDLAGNTADTELALAVNPVPTTVAAATPTPTPVTSSDSTPAPTATPVASPQPTLAPTGDPVMPISLIAISILIAATLGLWRLSRLNER